MKRIIAACISTIMVACVTISAAADDPIGTYDSWKPDLKEYTSRVCDEYGVDYSLVLGVIYNESRFKSGLTHMNSNGTIDYGLMQVNEVNFKYLNKTLGITSMNQLLDDRVGIRCGVHLLAYHKNATGNDSAALLRYQVGEGTYRKYVKNGKHTNDTHGRVWQYRDVYHEYLNQTIAESKLDGFVKRDPIESILNTWAEMLT
uniref:transglycosylase SLT domain-containing protein n=1 Tax=Faecalibacterium prausnitzii TaxID=853 RepID=UPI004025D0E2